MRCFLNRWRISRAHDDGSGPSSASARHIEGCESCAAFAARLDQMGRLLGSGAALAAKPEGVQGLGERRRARLRLVGVAMAAAVTTIFVILGLSLSRTPLLSELPAADVPSEAAPREVVKNDTAPIDVDALAGDASGGLRYVLRVSGLGSE